MTWNDLPRDPSTRTLRQFAALCTVVFGSAGSARLPTPTGVLLLVLAIGLGMAGSIRPRLLRPLFVGWLVAVFPIGWLVSRLVLGLIYFGVFAPLALWFRLRGRDGLGLRRRGVGTYWVARDDQANVARYYQQF